MTKTIPQLGAAAALSGAEPIETVQSGVSVRTTAQDVADLASGGGYTVVGCETDTVATQTLNYVNRIGYLHKPDGTVAIISATSTALADDTVGQIVYVKANADVYISTTPVDMIWYSATVDTAGGFITSLVQRGPAADASDLGLPQAFGTNPATTDYAALTYGYFGGKIGNHTYDDGIKALTDDAINYIEVIPGTGVSKNTTGFTLGANPMILIEMIGGELDGYSDRREWLKQLVDTSIIRGTTPTSDVAPGEARAQGGNAWAKATGGNTIGAAAYLLGGIGTRHFEVADWTALAGKTFAITTNGAQTIYIEGAEWDAETSNAVTASNIAATIGSIAEAVTEFVYLQPSQATRTFVIESEDGVNLIPTMGANGAVILDSTGVIAGGYSAPNLGVTITDDGRILAAASSFPLVTGALEVSGLAIVNFTAEFGAITPLTGTIVTQTITGLDPEFDRVSVSCISAPPSGLIIANARVSADDTLEILISTSIAIGITLGSLDFSVTITRILD